jgi:hypothetical protein
MAVEGITHGLARDTNKRIENWEVGECFGCSVVEDFASDM